MISAADEPKDVGPTNIDPDVDLMGNNRKALGRFLVWAIAEAQDERLPMVEKYLFAAYGALKAEDQFEREDV